MKLATIPSTPPAEDTGPWPESTFGPLIGPSDVMRRLFARLDRLAAARMSVLIEGETGTGKDLVARALHERSPRARAPFVPVDCGALSGTLLEGELFGHARGAFTDARSARAGAIEAAEGGTVFLDEIGELPLCMQPRLLRAIETRTVKRLGENEHRPVDVRFLCATHRDLEARGARGEFREDLYFRLAVLRVRVPALRERLSDIPALAEGMLPGAAHRLLTPALLAELRAHDWSGNVRELRNVLERVALLGPQECLPGRRPGPGVEAPPPQGPLSFREFREGALRTLERAYLTSLLERHGHCVTAAAVEAQIDRTHLHRLIRRHGL
jgi:two-component system response regulator GlrR